MCNLIFRKTEQKAELLSSHGYSHNQINVWSLPYMDKVASLQGHQSRVLYLALSPDQQTVVSGAGDETLRFWHLQEAGVSSV